MNRLFEALSDLGMDQPSPKAVRRAVSPPKVIRLDVSAIGMARLKSSQELETEQISPEAIPPNISPFDLAPILAALEAEEQVSLEAIPRDVTPSEVAPILAALEAEAQVSPEAIPRDVTLSEVERPDGFDVGTAPSLPTREAAVAKDSQPKSAEYATARSAHVKVRPESRLVALTDPNSLGAEKFRALVTRLDHLRKQRGLKSFQVTSTVNNEGKILVSGNVAVTLAKYFGSKTLLIEGDLHRPTLATIFGLNKMRGLSHWWSGRDQELAQFVHRLDDLPLWFLSAGKPCDRPSDILRSDRFEKAFAQLASQFEWVVVDSTPMLPIVDVNLWSRLVDGTLLVVREGVTPVKALKQGLRALDHPNLIGVVLNEASATDEAKYDGQYYGSTNRS